MREEHCSCRQKRASEERTIWSGTEFGGHADLPEHTRKPSGANNNNNNINTYDTECQRDGERRARTVTLPLTTIYFIRRQRLDTVTAVLRRIGYTRAPGLPARTRSSAVRGWVGTRRCAGAAVFQHARPPTRRGEKRRCTATTDSVSFKRRQL
ncbi:hypothetical protein ACI65C_012178 [Semiaphis heraclei]